MSIPLDSIHIRHVRQSLISAPRRPLGMNRCGKHEHPLWFNFRYRTIGFNSPDVHCCLRLVKVKLTQRHISLNVSNISIVQLHAFSLTSFKTKMCFLVTRIIYVQAESFRLYILHNLRHLQQGYRDICGVRSITCFTFGFGIVHK